MCASQVSEIPAVRDFLLDMQRDMVIHRRALLPQLPVAALCPLLSAGGQVNLHICIRQDHCGNVPAVHDHVVLFGHIPLHIQQEVPHRRDLGSELNFEQSRQEVLRLVREQLSL